LYLDFLLLAVPEVVAVAGTILAYSIVRLGFLLVAVPDALVVAGTILAYSIVRLGFLLVAVPDALVVAGTILAYSIVRLHFLLVCVPEVVAVAGITLAYSIVRLDFLLVGVPEVLVVAGTTLSRQSVQCIQLIRMVAIANVRRVALEVVVVSIVDSVFVSYALAEWVMTVPLAERTPSLAPPAGHVVSSGALHLPSPSERLPNRMSYRHGQRHRATE
jgi:hypothetical protein